MNKEVPEVIGLACILESSLSNFGRVIDGLKISIVRIDSASDTVSLNKSHDVKTHEKYFKNVAKFIPL